MAKESKKADDKKEKKSVSSRKNTTVSKTSTKKEVPVKDKNETKIITAKKIAKNVVKKTDSSSKSVAKKKEVKPKEIKEKVVTKKAGIKKTVASKKVAPKEIPIKKTAIKKSDTSKKVVTKKTPVKKVVVKETVTSKKVASKKTPAKKTVAKKSSASKKTVAKKTTSKKVAKVTPNQDINILEYYDLPYRYNETIVKLLAQTPTILFVYWDISEKDRENFTNQYGDEFFNKTKPVLLIHNETKNYTFEIDIDDFANCWYIHVQDTSSKYKIELGRRAKQSDFYIPNDYLYVTSSNVIESPNDHILFDNNSMAYFRNVKNGTVMTKNLATLTFMRNIGKIYDIYNLYKKLYKDEISNPSSLDNPSSGMFFF